MSLSQKKAFIFDLDGTIVDSLDVWSDVDEMLATQLGAKHYDREAVNHLRQTSLAKHRNAPSPYQMFCADFGKYIGSDKSGKEIHALRYAISRQALRTKVGLRQDIVPVLNYLKQVNKRLCVATTTRRENIEIYSHQNEIITSQIKLSDIFEFFITVEDVQRIKPDPECYRIALNRLGISAKDAVVIEDSCAGLEAAHAAGLDCVIVAERHSSKDATYLKKAAQWYFESHQTLLAALINA